MEAELIHYNIHKDLPRSDENKCMWTHSKNGTNFCCVFTYFYSLLIEKAPCECWNVKLRCAILVNLCLSSWDLFIFSVTVYLLYSYFCGNPRSFYNKVQRYIHMGTFTKTCNKCKDQQLHFLVLCCNALLHRLHIINGKHKHADPKNSEFLPDLYPFGLSMPMG